MSRPYRLTLDYTANPGWLAPYVDGLAEGRAVARRCACGHTSFPPLSNCPACGSGEAKWRPLSGAATIRFRTTGADGDHALVRFDGASTAAVVCLEDLPASASRATLKAPGSAQNLPQLILVPLTEEPAR